MSVTEAKIREALMLFDKDADGHVLPNETIMSQLALGIYLTPDQRNAFDEKVSKGLLDYDSAANLIMGVTKNRNPSEELIKMFAPFDTKKDGTISANELKAVLENLGEILSVPEIEKIMNQFAKNDRIVYRDLIAYLLE